MAKRAELEGEAQPVGSAPPTADMSEVGIAQDAVPEKVRLARGKGEQRLALAGGEHGGSGHDRILPCDGIPAFKGTGSRAIECDTG